MAETAEQQRTRILADSDCSPVDYDLALALGYQPESWDGMWKLTARDTFTYRHGCVIAREAVNAEVTRLVAHPLPEGWSLIEDQRVTFVSPRDQAWAKAHARM